MIAILRGALLEKKPGLVIVDVGGVGYEVAVPISAFPNLPDSGGEVHLRIHTHVREDALALFGFMTAEEKTLFEKLIGVSGIGPKLAMNVLSGVSSGDLINAIRNGQTEWLVRIPGVGKKTAERIVLELRDKLEGIGDGGKAPTPSKAPALTDLETDVLSALLNLGCQRAAAETAIRKASGMVPEQDFERLFRRSLELVR